MVKWYLCTHEIRRVKGGGNHAMKIAWHEGRGEKAREKGRRMVKMDDEK